MISTRPLPPPLPLGPRPLPRYARPGGYSPRYTGDPHTGGGPIGNMFGWNGNPVYEAFKKPEVADLFRQVGIGLLREPNFGDGLAYGLERSSANLPGIRDESRKAEMRDRYARTLLGMGDEFRPLADAVSQGVVEPADAWNQAYQYQAESRQRAILEAQNRGNATMIKDPDLRQMVESGALTFKDALEYEREATQGPSGSYGNTIELGQDANGNLVPLRAAPGGGLAVAPLPEGVEFIPGGMSGARAGQTVDARSAAAARAALPGAEQTMEITLGAIDSLRNDKQGQAEQFGSLLGVVPNRAFGAFPGTPMANFQVNLNQASGQAFMQAREMLKGGGQITDFEGRRAEAAMSRIEDAARIGDVKAFEQALDDFEQAVVEGYRKLREAASGSYASGGPLAPGGGVSPGDYKSRYNLE